MSRRTSTSASDHEPPAYTMALAIPRADRQGGREVDRADASMDATTQHWIEAEAEMKREMGGMGMPAARPRR